MGTSAFDKLWDEATPKRRATDKAPDASFDALWGEEPITPPSPTQAMVRQALKTPEGKRRLEQGNQEKFVADLPNVVTEIIPEKAGQILSTVAATGRDIPGVEAAQAAVRGLVRGQPYRQSLAEMRESQESLPTLLRAPARMAGAGLSMAALPGSTAMQGARYGVLRGMAQADDADVSERLKDAVLEGTVGLVAGKGADYAGTALKGAKAAITGSTAAKAFSARKAARSAAASPKYDAFRDLGELERTPALDDILSLPSVQTALQQVKAASPKTKNLSDTDALVLDRVYKRIGNKAFKDQHGIETDEARDALKAAIEEAAQKKGGSYEAALDVFRKGSQGLQAVKRGAMTLRSGTRPTGTPLDKVDDFGPESFDAFAKRATADEKAGAAEGIVGELARRPLLARIGGLRASTSVPVPFPSRFTREANSLLEQVRPDTRLSRFLKSLATANTLPQP